MKTILRLLIFFAMTLLVARLMQAQDLSRYRGFPLGASLSELSSQFHLDTMQSTTIQTRPAVIQEANWWPSDIADSSPAAEQVSQVVLTFYNGDLYRILVTYERDAVEGLTDEDMVEAISAKYGTPTRPHVTVSFPKQDLDSPAQQVIARWQDGENSLNLLHSSVLNTFELVLFSKQINAQADAAIIQGAKLDQQQTPQLEIDHQQKEASDLESMREKNKKSFQP
jgi:hypothetical protein